MANIAMEFPPEVSQQMERLVRDGWFPDLESIVRDAVRRFIEGKSYLGDSPAMLHRFAADALNESKPEIALKFVERGVSLLASDPFADLTLYQRMIELRVQILLVLSRDEDARAALEEAREKLPNSPGITRWLARIKRREVPA